MINLHFNVIQTINPHSNDYKDLAFFKSLLDNVQIVLLGEQNHGDGSTFLAKTRLIKFLHQELNFNVLAFESGFYECNQAFANYSFPDNIFNVQKNIYSIWRDSKQMIPLFNYLAHNKNIILTGFDCRHKGEYAKKNLINELTHYLSNIDKKLVHLIDVNNFIKLLNDLLIYEYKHHFHENDKIFFLKFIDNLSSIRNNGSDFWIQELKNIKAFAQNSWARLDVDIRDGQMADNFLWLLNNKFPTQKIIVWAHNYHIMRNMKYVRYVDNDDDKRGMGVILDENINGKIYSIGFTSYEGYYSQLKFKKRCPIPRSLSNSFSTFLGKKEFNYAFFETKNMKEYITMNGIFHRSDNAKWNTVYDGMFFIKEMVESQKAS